MRRSVAPVIAALAALGAAALLIAGSVKPVTARFSGTTDSRGSLLRTAVVDLELAGGATGASSSLAIDAANLVPGDRVERCLAVGYSGSASGVDVRLLGRRDGGSGLEAYLSLTVESGSGVDPGCTDFVATQSLVDAPLVTMWSEHGTYETGVPVLTGVDDGAATTVRIVVELLDDDRAQGHDTGFWLVLEARP